MAGGLITLPLRLGVRAASLSLRVTEEIVTRTLSLVTGGGGSTTEAEPASEPSSPTQRESRRPATNGASETVAPPARDPEADAAAAAPETPAPPAVEEQPPAGEGLFADTTHVSEEPVIVEELADPGAEEGAGAQIHIEEPWEGYRRMNASEVISRVDTATAAELAAVTLYESAHQARQTVLQAVERQLEKLDRSGASD